ncbi:MAG: transcription initiation factor IIB [Candidatus Bathyarchaeota archaeon]|nr:MAG: transcription initiation factor IIB [Candidatus Bathyarchaeota archaeon]
MQHLLPIDGNECPECSTTILITDYETGEITCSHCGLVLRVESLDRRPEYRAFTFQEWNSRLRTGLPIVLRMYDKGLSTIFYPSRDVHGRFLSKHEQIKMKRLKRWQIRARLHSTAHKNLMQAMVELSLLVQKLHLPLIVEENAALIYRKTRQIQVLRKRSIQILVAASCYAACRITQTPRTLKEIAEASFRSRKEVARCYRLIRRSLVLNIPNNDPVHFISQIASKLGISQRTQHCAIDLLQQSSQKHIVSGKNPIGFAAAVLYIAARLTAENISQKRLAQIAMVTEVTIRTRYQELDRVLRLGLS